MADDLNSLLCMACACRIRMTVGAILTYWICVLEIGMGFSKSLAAVTSAELEAVWLRINIAPKTLSAPVEVDLLVHLSESSGKFCQTR
jgi:hypothetical protein